ncbi:MAG: DUF692 family multinuclear iron-containing protein [Phototrophicaceae bacterium]
MQFAVNWSPEAASLLDDGIIQIDLFKCPDWDNLVADAKAQHPSYIHFPLTIGTNQRPSWDFKAIHHWLATTDTQFVNCHITPNTAVFPSDISHDDLMPSLIDDVQTLVNEFGKERVIIENCPYFAGNVADGYMQQGINPQVFHDIITATGCGFLLDMAHVVLVTDFLGWSFEDIICALPVQHIREFHITGIGAWSTGVRGDHMPMEAVDWQRLDFCVEQFKAGVWRVPDVIAFEYGGIEMLKDLCGSDKHALETQVPRLYQIAHDLSESSLRI